MRQIHCQYHHILENPQLMDENTFEELHYQAE